MANDKFYNEVAKTKRGDLAKLYDKLNEDEYTPRLTINDTDLVSNRIRGYFEWCDEKDRAPTVPGIATSIGITRRTMMKWLNDLPNHPTSQTIQFALDAIADEIESGALTGKYAGNVATFTLRTQHGYQEQKETTIIHKKFEEKKSIEQLEKEISEEIIDAEFDEISDES